MIESQAIAWFAQGCKHGSMLWQRLQREMPATLAEMIRIADSYALGDPSQPWLNSAEQSKKYPATMVPDHLGGMIARIMGIRGGMTSRITGMVQTKWQQLSMINRVVVTARDLRMMAIMGPEQGQHEAGVRSEQSHQ